jgi:hypothetical protein
MMGIGRCKDLDEWLVGSGESAETADSAKRGINTSSGQNLYSNRQIGS